VSPHLLALVLVLTSEAREQPFWTKAVGLIQHFAFVKTAQDGKPGLVPVDIVYSQRMQLW